MTLPDLNLVHLTEFVTFAERPKPTKHWLQNMWGWAASGLSQYRNSSDEALRQLSTDVRNGVCESAFCAAGHGAFESGHRLIYNDHAVANGQSGTTLGLTATYCIAERPKVEEGTGLPVLHGGHRVWEDVPGAPLESISTVGMDWYGLDEREAEAFFYATNDIDDMKSLINGFCEVRDIDLPYPSHEPIGAHDHLVEHGEYDEDD